MMMIGGYLALLSVLAVLLFNLVILLINRGGSDGPDDDPMEYEPPHDDRWGGP